MTPSTLEHLMIVTQFDTEQYCAPLGHIEPPNNDMAYVHDDDKVVDIIFGSNFHKYFSLVLSPHSPHSPGRTLNQ